MFRESGSGQKPGARGLAKRRGWRRSAIQRIGQGGVWRASNARQNTQLPATETFAEHAAEADPARNVWIHPLHPAHRSWFAVFRLLRISNIPTVWTNVVAAAHLAGEPSMLVVLVGGLMMSVVYGAGMILNDIFDIEEDRIYCPDRPLASGAVSLDTAHVLAFGGVLLSLALHSLLLAVLGLQMGHASWGSLVGLWGTVLAYNAWHRGNPGGFVLMAMCRGLVYVTVGLLIPAANWQLLSLGVLGVTAYTAGISLLKTGRNGVIGAVAMATAALGLGLGAGEFNLVKGVLAVAAFGWCAHALAPLVMGRMHEVDRCTGRWIAGMALLDAVFIAGVHPGWACVAACGVPLTRTLHRSIRGT